MPRPSPAPPDLRSDRPPLTARSVVASVLLGVEPPWLPTSSLVATAGLFGIAEGTVRVAISRMASAGEVEPVDGGYRLAGHLADRQIRQRESRRLGARPWDGTWEVAVVVDRSREATERVDLRRALHALRMAEVREGVWVRPANLDPDRSPDAAEVRDRQCTVFSARGRAGRNDALDPAALWDLDSWRSTARDLIAEMTVSGDRLIDDDPNRLAPAFELAAAVVRHLVADPLLPGALWPPGWEGDRLRAAYETYEAAFNGALARWRRRAGSHPSAASATSRAQR